MDDADKVRFDSRDEAIFEARRYIVRLAVIWFALTGGALWSVFAGAEPRLTAALLMIALTLLPGMAFTYFLVFRSLWRGEFTLRNQNLTAIPALISALFIPVIGFWLAFTGQPTN